MHLRNSIHGQNQKKVLNNGSYEHVLSAKIDRPVLYGHSPFNNNAYLSTYGAREAEGAELMAPHSSAQHEEIQEDICIRSKTDTRPAEKRDVLQAGLDRDYGEAEVGDYNPGHEDSSGQENEGSGSPGPGQ